MMKTLLNLRIAGIHEKSASEQYLQNYLWKLLKMHLRLKMRSLQLYVQWADTICVACIMIGYFTKEAFKVQNGISSISCIQNTNFKV